MEFVRFLVAPRLAVGAAVFLAVAVPANAQDKSKPAITPPKVDNKRLPDFNLIEPELTPKRSAKAPAKLPALPKRSPASEPTNANQKFPTLLEPTPIDGAPQATVPQTSSPPPQTVAVPKTIISPKPPQKLAESSSGAKPLPLPPPDLTPRPRPTEVDPEIASPWAKVNADSVYRPLAAIVQEGEERRHAPVQNYPNEWVPLPKGPQLPTAIPGGLELMCPVEECREPSWFSESMKGDHWLRVAPSDLLWQPFLTNPREPRMAAKALRIDGETNFDAAVGGQFGLLRISPEARDHEGFQLDVFAAAFTRVADSGDLIALDYRFGVPITYAAGCWQFKFAYERMAIDRQAGTAVPAGGVDDFRRDELVFGVGRRWWDILRVYGQLGFTFAGTEAQTDEPLRGNFGVEWADLRCTTPTGSPFAALDVEIRGDQDNKPGVTAQLGWNWRGQTSGRGPRVAFEYRTGRSPLGQFFSQNEETYGLVAAFDW
jgi:hypothetical protein